MIEIWSPLAPEGSDAETASQLADPIQAVGELLDQEIRRRANNEPEPELKESGDRWRGGVHTDLSPLDQKSVWTKYDQFLTMPTSRELARKEASGLDSTQWVHDRLLKSVGGYAPWRLRIRLVEGLSASDLAREALSQAIPGEEIDE